MKKIFFLTLVVFCVRTYSNDIFTYKLNKDEKLEATYSAELDGNNTFHIAIIKKNGDKQFLYKPVFINDGKKVIECEIFSSKAKYEFLSHHINQNIISLVNYDEDSGKIDIYDFDSFTGKMSFKSLESKVKPKSVFRFQNKSVLVYFDKGDGVFSTKEINSSSLIDEKNIVFNENEKEKFRNTVGLSPQATNQDEYVRNGSIKESKSFYINNAYYIISQKYKRKIDVYKFDTQSKTIINQTIQTKLNEETKIRDFSNYLYNNRIVTLSVLENDIVLESTDITNLNSKSTFSLKEKFEQSKIDNYIKVAGKHNFRPTITINKNITGKPVVRLDNVDEDKYQYNNNWWFDMWWFHQQIWHQQHMMQMNTYRGFGPSQNWNEESLFFETEKLNESFEFVLDDNFMNLEKEEINTIHKNIDREKYLEKYKKDKEKKEFSSAFTSKEHRYFYFDKNNQTIKIGFEML